MNETDGKLQETSVTAPSHRKSDELHTQALGLTPGGVHSNVRMQGPLVFFERGQGAWLWDVDGNDYVDYLLGQGPNFLGHAPSLVSEAVAEACERGVIYGAQHPLEVVAARSLLEALGWADMVRFGLSGTEMVQAALRLARAATGRRKFLRFEGHYHGWLDNVLLGSSADDVPGPASAGQLPSHLDDCIILPWNDVTALEYAMDQHADEIAAVLTEPMMCNNGAVSPREGYLQRMRELCDQHGSILVFDEVITGFRLALGGAAEHFGVAPDLATYGKAMAGGWPVAALAGRGDLMARFARDVTHAGTFNASVMACAAVAATVNELRENPPYERAKEHGEAVMAGISALAKAYDLPLRVQGPGIAFHVSFGHQDTVNDFRELQALDLQRYSDFARQLAQHGVWVAGRGIWYVSTAHGDRELNVVLERFESTLKAMTSCQHRG
jgi:glutamate-1-semialdehyde 2,1-aminomutase